MQRLPRSTLLFFILPKERLASSSGITSLSALLEGSEYSNIFQVKHDIFSLCCQAACQDRGSQMKEEVL